MRSEEELRLAVQPVAQHHFRAELSETTVLAAWLRSVDVVAGGPAWLEAKKLLKAGYDFPQIARKVAERAGSAPRRASEAAVANSHPAEASHAPRRAAPAEPAHEPADVDTLREQDAIPLGRLAHGTLQLKAKRYSEGDIDGTGTRNLLGRSAYDPVNVLVRETAQNSWDARSPRAEVIEFTMHLRSLSEAARRILTDKVFREVPPDSSMLLRTHLSSPGPLWVLEISDRGTRGLGGPVRNDIAVGHDQRTDFSDFVLSLGAPRDQSMGGGTYGYGKTIAYTSSRASTVLISTRTLHHGVEQRVIASAMGASYETGGYRYTGRHWWGRLTEDERVEPVVGKHAEDLTRELFAKGWGEGQLGTSLLILAPDMDGLEPRAYASALANAALVNLWPKLVPAPGKPVMDIRVRFEDELIEIPDPSEHPVFRHFVTSLQSVRAVQGGAPLTSSVLTQLAPMVDGRGRGLTLGHLAMTSFVKPAGEDSGAFADAVGCHHVCWMRHDAELVVKYEPGPPRGSGEMEWAGVFKPVADFDDAFAHAEPPSHDDWLPNSVPDKDEKSRVKVSLDKMRAQLRDWLTPQVEQVDNKTQGLRSLTALADALAGLVMAAPGNRPTLEPSRRSSDRSGAGSRAPKSNLKVVDERVGPVEDDGTQQMALLVECTGRPVQVEPTVAFHTIVGADSDEEACFVWGWDRADGERVDLDQTPEFLTLLAKFRPGDRLWLRVVAEAGLAVEVKFSESAE